MPNPRNPLELTVVRLMDKHGVDVPDWQRICIVQAPKHPTSSVNKDYPLAEVKREVEMSRIEQFMTLLGILCVPVGVLLLIALGAWMQKAGVLHG